ncbi:DUF2147 domain-containing protein [Dyadobacter sandarakinus]|uniref:DUF2147 domain-containing protein n=1 Tax=Dyadobacter sandarakinus TaxID=2747268 RepID=A0ABX7I4B6_9BACT|nr:DUF2147 domain-containing protein [Dyadobacter sandarakinus]QRR00412.1 DUF2147 domain-containing protein [Dyadobacter sandarakinus]
MFHAVFSQEPADQVIGEWISEDQNTRLEIYKSGSVYNGRFIAGQNLLDDDGKEFRKDVQNPDEKLRGRPLNEVEVFSGFLYEDGLWDNGKMYDSKTGRTYSCFMKLRDQTLEIRSYVGIPLFGKSTYWKKNP